MKPLNALLAEQARGAHPADNAWVSASAGTGKTQVLSARVLRLLLDGNAPDGILCLTFTKAGAAEMQTRVFDRLAHWVRAGDNALRSDLAAIRADTSDKALTVARQLFAQTLDSKGGLRVQTIHAYAQSLLASFPVEAGVTPGFATLADRDAAVLRARILAETIEAASAKGDRAFLDDVGAISIARGESAFDRIAGVLIRHAPAIDALGPPTALIPRLRRAFGLPSEGTSAEVLAALVARLDEPGLKALAHGYEQSGVATYTKRADTILWWLACKPEARVEHITDLCKVFHTGKDERFATLAPGGKKADPALVDLADRLCAAIDELVETRRLLEVTDNAARHLRVGLRFGAAYALHKRRAGVIDYDDMIASAAALLNSPGMGDWVRFKLDARIDHLLVDEAQDTNPSQWAIVEALSDEFFVGKGARELVRTLFVVGDFKQAIFAFQGSDPQVFDDQRDIFRERIVDGGGTFEPIDLDTSFRSVPAVLDVVDKVVEQLGHKELGTKNPIPPSRAARLNLPGAVTLWPPLFAPADDEPTPDEARKFVPPAQVRMAHELAKQIAAWLEPSTALRLPARDRNVRADDILVLVRNRGEFIQPLVAALHQFGVPVAGADRLRLTEPIAVQDLLAVVRFVLQPGDDLTCATLLTSPFVGLDHDALFALAYDRSGTLWDRVRNAKGPAADWLGTVLALADFSAPYEFLETILSGTLQGRCKLLARLGEEARDAIDAVLAQALAFEVANAPTLQGFLAWMENEDTEIKRDPDAPFDAVRIMTVHGAKGLQAPVVILADAARGRDDRDDHVMVRLDGEPVPIFHGGKVGKVGAIGAAAERAHERQMHEHWRLLYVALTRAEDLLFVGGALTKTGKLPPESWHAKVGEALVDLKAVTEPDSWGGTLVHRACVDGLPAPDTATARPASLVLDLPAWATAPAPPEARPPRPLSPSAIAADDIAMPPPTPAMQAAALRGTRLHALFERLPQIPPADRASAADRWLTGHAADLDAAQRQALADTALNIIADPRFAALFGPDGLAEAPIAAVVDGIVIAGKVDRLLVEPDRIQLVDFKTGTRVPADADAVEPYYLRQMAAYVAALGAIFPARRIDAALLYTHDATLIELPTALLAQYKPRLGQGEATLG